MLLINREIKFCTVVICGPSKLIIEFLKTFSDVVRTGKAISKHANFLI